MKKIIDEIRKWATLAAFCGAAVAGYWNIQEFKQFKVDVSIERIKDRASIDSNTVATGKVVRGQIGILEWMKNHNIRHDDHHRQHEAERDNP